MTCIVHVAWWMTMYGWLNQDLYLPGNHLNVDKLGKCRNLLWQFRLAYENRLDHTNNNCVDFPMQRFAYHIHVTDNEANVNEHWAIWSNCVWTLNIRQIAKQHVGIMKSNRSALYLKRRHRELVPFSANEMGGSMTLNYVRINCEWQNPWLAFCSCITMIAIHRRECALGKHATFKWITIWNFMANVKWSPSLCIDSFAWCVRGSRINHIYAIQFEYRWNKLSNGEFMEWNRL